MYKNTTIWVATAKSGTPDNYIYESETEKVGFNHYIYTGPAEPTFATTLTPNFKWDEKSCTIRPANEDEVIWFKACLKAKKLVPRLVALYHNKILKTDLKKIHEIACEAWKSVIQDLASDPQFAFEDYVMLKDDMVVSMYQASDEKQKAVLSKYLPQPKPKFKAKDLDSGQLMSCHHNDARFIGKDSVGSLFWISYENTVHTRAGAMGDVEGDLLPEGTVVKIIAK